MDLSRPVSAGGSPMLNFVVWAFVLALSPGAAAVAWAVLKRCRTTPEEQEAIFRPPEPGTLVGDRRYGGFAVSPQDRRSRDAFSASHRWNR